MKPGKIYGSCDLGDIVPIDSEDWAQEALVFLIISYRNKFKSPVDYFLINKLSAALQS